MSTPWYPSGSLHSHTWIQCYTGKSLEFAVIGSALAAREANKRVEVRVKLYMYQQYHNFRENCDHTKLLFSKSKLLIQSGLFYEGFLPVPIPSH